jgi:hypothetical protein
MSRSSSQKSRTAATAEKVERRANLRHQLTVGADVTELKSGARLTTRTNDISLGGCFVDALAPHPVGTRVRLSISKGGESFEALGEVAYSQAGLGMGIAFTSVLPGHTALLDSWLLEFGGDYSASPEETPKPAQSQKADNPERALTIKLIRLLIARRLLTEEDARNLLRDALL